MGFVVYQCEAYSKNQMNYILVMINDFGVCVKLSLYRCMVNVICN